MFLFVWKGTLMMMARTARRNGRHLALDLGRVVENSLEEHEERYRAVATWISTTV